MSEHMVDYEGDERPVRVDPFPKGCRVEPNEIFRSLYPRTKVRGGTVTGMAQKTLGYRVKWDEKVTIETVAGRYLRRCKDEQAAG